MKVMIMGATSGLGKGVAELFAKDGHLVGIAGRRTDRLEEIAAQYPDHIRYKTIDVNDPNALSLLKELIEEMEGVDLFLYSSGVGKTSSTPDMEIEDRTNEVNAVAFTKMAVYLHDHFLKHGHGHLAVISSIAGLRGLGPSPSYSASKGYQRIYLESLSQSAKKLGVPIRYSTIIPGFIATDFITDGKYPMVLSPERAVKIIYRGLIRKKRKIYVDTKWRCVGAIMRLTPTWLWEKIKL